MRSIAVSSGDMALILGGYKSLHFMRLAEGESLPAGEVVHFTHTLEGGTHFSIPVTITSSSPERSNSPLSYLDEWKSGRISATQKRSFSPEVSEKRWTKIKPTLASRIARQFLSRFETPLPTELFAADIAGTDSAHPIQRFSFALKLTPDASYSLSELYRRFKTAHDILAPRITYAHRYQFSNHGHNGELLSPPEASELSAMRHLASHHTPVHLPRVLARLKEPYELLSQLNRAINASQPIHVPAPDPDGINKALAGLPSIPCSLDTGSLAVMGLTKRIAVRNPLPHPEATSSTRTAVLYATGHGNAIASQLRNFQVPITIDMAPEHMHIFSSATIDKSIAKQHGYANIRDMRASIGLNPDEICDIISYPFTLARPESLPLDSDRTGKHRIQQEHAARTIVTRSGTSEQKRLQRYIDTLPDRERFFALANITPPKAHTPEMSEAAGPAPRNKKGTRQLPNDVIAKRKAAPHKRKAEPTTTLLHGFDGLAAALEEKTASAPAPRPEPKPAKHVPRYAPSKPIVTEAGISPLFTTPDEIAANALGTNDIHREGIDANGVPHANAPIMPKHKTLDDTERADHIEQARAAKKPRDKDKHAAETRVRDNRTHRRSFAQTLRSAQNDPAIRSEEGQASDSWAERLSVPRRGDRDIG